MTSTAAALDELRAATRAAEEALAAAEAEGAPISEALALAIDVAAARAAEKRASKPADAAYARNAFVAALESLTQTPEADDADEHAADQQPPAATGGATNDAERAFLDALNS